MSQKQTPRYSKNNTRNKAQTQLHHQTKKKAQDNMTHTNTTTHQKPPQKTIKAQITTITKQKQQE